MEGHPEHAVVWVRGEHDIASRVMVAVGIARAAQGDDPLVLVDLSGVTFMDASIVGVIVGRWNRLRAQGQSLELRAPSPLALRVLEVCELGGLVRREPRHSSSAAALATWIDVAPTDPARTDPEDGRLRAVVGARQPDRMLTAAIDLDEATATVDVDHSGS